MIEEVRIDPTSETNNWIIVAMKHSRTVSVMIANESEHWRNCQ